MMQILRYHYEKLWHLIFLNAEHVWISRRRWWWWCRYLNRYTCRYTWPYRGRSFFLDFPLAFTSSKLDGQSNVLTGVSLLTLKLALDSFDKNVNVKSVYLLYARFLKTLSALLSVFSILRNIQTILYTRERNHQEVCGTRGVLLTSSASEEDPFLVKLQAVHQKFYEREIPSQLFF